MEAAAVKRALRRLEARGSPCACRPALRATCDEPVPFELRHELEPFESALFEHAQRRRVGGSREGAHFVEPKVVESVVECSAHELGCKAATPRGGIEKVRHF